MVPWLVVYESNDYQHIPEKPCLCLHIRMQLIGRKATRSHGRAFVDLVLPIILVRASICEAIFARADKIWMDWCQRSDITCQDTGLKLVHDRF